MLAIAHFVLCIAAIVLVIEGVAAVYALLTDRFKRR